jgi:hypothetical protein
LAEGLQEALWQLGGAPAEHRTDRLSAAYKNLTAHNDAAAGYAALCQHYGMEPTRNNAGVSHENGGVAAAHGHLKRGLQEALLLRGSCDFADLAGYQAFLQDFIARKNARRREAVAVELPALRPLPRHRTTDFSTETVSVTTTGTIRGRGVLYTVPSRLVGCRLKVHVYDNRLLCFLGPTEVPGQGDSRYFGLVQNQDNEPRRLREVLRDQGLPVNQAITVLTDGGDSLHAFVGDLSANDKHYLDWFHIAMRLTGLTQYAKGLAHHNPIEAVALHSRLESIKWRLWHGNAHEALTRAREVAEDVAALTSGYPGLTRLVKAAAGLASYIANNADAIADYAKRWLTGEIISTAFVESTVNAVVSRRFAKKQQMQWSRMGAHRLLRTRTQTLDGTLRETFVKWYPAMAANDDQIPAAAAAV